MNSPKYIVRAVRLSLRLFLAVYSVTFKAKRWCRRWFNRAAFVIRPSIELVSIAAIYNCVWTAWYLIKCRG